VVFVRVDLQTRASWIQQLLSTLYLEFEQRSRGQGIEANNQSRQSNQEAGHCSVTTMDTGAKFANGELGDPPAVEHCKVNGIVYLAAQRMPLLVPTVQHTQKGQLEHPLNDAEMPAVISTWHSFNRFKPRLWTRPSTADRWSRKWSSQVLGRAEARTEIRSFLQHVATLSRIEL
jgi:hypothetical protein